MSLSEMMTPEMASAEVMSADAMPCGEVPTLVPALVDCIERELRRLHLWESRPPPDEAFSSDMPFHFDTMSLVQWLQWVFVPRMRRLLRNRMPLPTACGILPIAADELGREGHDTGPLLAFIGRLDLIITERGRRLH